MATIPANRPQLPPETVRAILRAKGITPTHGAPALLGIRGYYERTMGNPASNDRGIYDDAMFLVTDSSVARFNANTDPSRRSKGIAMLEPGVWGYETGFHGITRGNPYPALRQRSAVTVRRDDVSLLDTGHFAINIHRGSETSTSSEGCQTIPPKQWKGFIDEVYRALGVPIGPAGARAKKPITYVLVTHDEAERLGGGSI